MTRKILKMGFAFFLIFITHNLTAQQDAKAIIKKAEQKMNGEYSKSTMTMEIKRPGWSRKVEMKSWSKGNDFYMILITAPAKEKGQVYLKRYNEMWNWVPSINRMIKIPPSMMMQSWMGSDFTNDDLVKQSTLAEDYTHKILSAENLRDQACYKVELIPKPDAPVVWGKIIMWVTQNGHNIWQAQYYDEDDYLVNTEKAYQLKKMDDRVIPTKLVMTPADDPGNETILNINNIQFNEKIDEGFFSQQNMKRMQKYL